MGAIAGVAATSSVLPVSVRAQTPAAAALINPPLAQPVPSGDVLATSYANALSALPGGPNLSMPDVLYALNSQTRTEMAIGNTSTDNFTGPAYTDGTVSDDEGVPIVGPTLEFTRGRTTGVWMRNTLTACGPLNNMAMSNPVTNYTPHGYTTTNLHTHGLHVSPEAPSDDVLLMIGSVNDPASTATMTEFPYRYVVPDDHPVGTFWYHPHKHGAVASQVGPGMSGALIIRGAEDETDFDDLLAEAPYNITAADEVVMVLQTLGYYDVAGASPSAQVFYADGYYKGTGQTDGVETPVAGCYAYGTVNLTYPTQPKTSVNGVVNPTLTMEKGAIKRLRIVNATNGQAYVPKFSAASGTSGTPPKVFAIATDGIALPVPFDYDVSEQSAPYFPIDYDLTEDESASLYWTTAEILTVAAGQRLDLLVQSVDAGTFTLAGAATGTAPMLIETGAEGSFAVLNTDTLLTLTVTADEPTTSQEVPPMSFYDNPQITRPEPPAVEINGVNMPTVTQAIEFKTVSSALSKNQPGFKINDQHFDASEPNAQLQLYLGHTDVWNVYSSNDVHVFHIHVNSFLTFARTKYDTSKSAFGDPIQYTVPVWRDTIYFEAGVSTSDVNFVPGTMAVFASKQVDYTGEYVLHCHNLFHEDAGMMMTVSVVDPQTGNYVIPSGVTKRLP
jgi:FtsP/CotA-like multicopper oxidase with cupredoxin domain